MWLHCVVSINIAHWTRSQYKQQTVNCNKHIIHSCRCIWLNGLCSKFCSKKVFFCERQTTKMKVCVLPANLHLMPIVSNCVKNINNNSYFIVFKKCSIRIHKTCTPLNLIDRLKDYLIDMCICWWGETRTQRGRKQKENLPNK